MLKEYPNKKSIRHHANDLKTPPSPTRKHVSTAFSTKMMHQLHNETNAQKQHLAFSPAAQGIHLPRLGSTFESQSDFSDDKEIDNGKNKESVKPKETSQEEKVEEFGVSVDNLKDETEDTHLSALIGDEHTETVPKNMVEDISEMDFVTKIEHVGDLQEADALNDKSEVTSPSYAQELLNKRLYA
nr:hypothetical protein [Tanacetum cinerariifolium]